MRGRSGARGERLVLRNMPAARAGETVAYDQPAAAINIARIKSALNLTPAQRAYWPPVESALRRVAREQQATSGGLIRRIGHRVVSIVLTGAAVRRLAVAARPLIDRLNDDQKTCRRAAGGRDGAGRGGGRAQLSQTAFDVSMRDRKTAPPDARQGGFSIEPSPKAWFCLSRGRKPPRRHNRGCSHRCSYGRRRRSYSSHRAPGDAPSRAGLSRHRAR